MASHLVDLGNTCQSTPSIVPTAVLSGGITSPTSGAIIGTGVDMTDSNSYCNLFVGGHLSGTLRVTVQCSDTDVSGSYTDPTSGFSVFPGAFLSGTTLWLNSGGDGGLLGAVVSGQNCNSGFYVAQGFIRTGVFVRAIMVSGAGQGAGPITAGFISQSRATGSGGGFSFSPTGGSVQV